MAEELSPEAVEAQLLAGLYNSGDSPDDQSQNVSPEDLAQALPPENPTPTVPPATAPVTEPPVAVVEPPVQDPPTPPVDDQKPLKPVDRVRVGTWSPVEQMAITIRAQSDGKISLPEALVKAEEILAVKDPAPTEPDPIAEMEKELSEVQARLDELAKDEGLYTPEIRELQKREAQLSVEARLAKADREAVARFEQEEAERSLVSAFDQEWNSAAEEAMTLYPDSAVEGSPLYAAVDEAIQSVLSNPQHPLHRAANIPMLIIPGLAARMGIAPTIQGQATPPPVVPPPVVPLVVVPPAQKMAPIGGGARTAVSDPPNLAQQQADLKQNLAEAGSPDEAYALLAGQIYGGDPSEASFDLQLQH